MLDAVGMRVCSSQFDDCRNVLGIFHKEGDMGRVVMLTKRNVGPVGPKKLRDTQAPLPAKGLNSVGGVMVNPRLKDAVLAL